MTDLATLFRDLLEQADQLDPTTIRATIRGTHDRLPGGARSSETGIRATRMERCADRTCNEGDWWDEDADAWHHDHPIPNDPTGDAAMRPSASEADLRLLDSLERDYIAAIGEISARSHSAAPPTTWDEAVKDHHLLDQMDAVSTLVSPWGHGKVRAWVEKAGDALSSIEHMANRHMPRDANDHEKSWTSGLADDQCCRVCLKLGLRVGWQDGGAGGLCQGCYRLRRRCATVNDIDPDEVPDPPESLIEELRRIGTPNSPADQAARSRWYQRVGDEHRGSRYCA